MKKLFLVLAVASVSMIACKKEMTCTCTGSLSAFSFDSGAKLDKDEQDAFEAACELLNLGATGSDKCTAE